VLYQLSYLTEVRLRTILHVRVRVAKASPTNRIVILLLAHNNGQWAKKVRGKIHFFGVIRRPRSIDGATIWMISLRAGYRIPRRHGAEELDVVVSHFHFFSLA
jgi:hypothetical protein